MNNFETNDASTKWSRRKFVASLAVAGVVSAHWLNEKASASTLTWVSVGSADSIKPGQVQKVTVGGLSIYLSCNDDKSFVALSAKCTHLGCTVTWDTGRNQYACPCHGGRFDQSGKNISGPPPRPLSQYEVRVDPDKTVYVKIPA